MASSIEDTLSRLSGIGGVEAYLIVDASGTILRQWQHKGEEALPVDVKAVAKHMTRLSQKARHVVRDLDPKNDLDIFRLRAKEHEILVAPGPDNAFTLIVIQRWSPTGAGDELAALLAGGTAGIAAGSGAAAAAAVSAAAGGAGGPPGTAAGGR